MITFAFAGLPTPSLLEFWDLGPTQMIHPYFWVTPDAGVSITDAGNPVSLYQGRSTPPRFAIRITYEG